MKGFQASEFGNSRWRAPLAHGYSSRAVDSSSEGCRKLETRTPLAGVVGFHRVEPWMMPIA